MFRHRINVIAEIADSLHLEKDPLSPYKMTLWGIDVEILHDDYLADKFFVTGEQDRLQYDYPQITYDWHSTKYNLWSLYNFQKDVIGFKMEINSGDKNTDELEDIDDESLLNILNGGGYRIAG